MWNQLSSKECSDWSKMMNIVDTENAPMTNIVTTGTKTIRGIAMTIRVIGDLGSNRIDTQENTHTYTNMEDIAANMDI
jgi:hypothetical protein